LTHRPRLARRVKQTHPSGNVTIGLAVRRSRRWRSASRPRHRCAPGPCRHSSEPCATAACRAPHDPGYRLDRHGRDHGHDQRLEQQGEAAVRPRPWHADRLDTARVAAYARHAGIQVGLVLEEVEVAPGVPLGVVGRAVRGTAVWTGKPAARGDSISISNRRAVASKSLRLILHGGVRASASSNRVVSRMTDPPHAARPARARRRARRRQGRCAPRKRAVACSHP
jgi:hypothetical protein